MSVPHTVRVFAPAKINLSLHVTGQRLDGYHKLDSLVCFANIGDTLTIKEQGGGDLTVSGPFGDHVPTDGSNSILMVARMFQTGAPLSFALHKELPIASGIGGGSADAAAGYRAITYLRKLHNKVLQAHASDLQRLLSVGADVPMCVASTPARVQGIGEEIMSISGLPELPIVLVNPGVGVSTPAVFKALVKKGNPAMTLMPKQISDPVVFLTWLREQRNDLLAAACQCAPEISDVLAALNETKGCLLSRMSGSGATCFGLFSSNAAAENAAHAIRAHHCAWWVRAGRLNGGGMVAPQAIRSTT